MPVVVANAVQKDVPVELRAIGNVEAYSTVSVKSQVQGQLARVLFQEGQAVKKGELIFQIDARPFEAALNQAQANLARERAQEKYAETEASRYSQLYQSGVVSKELFDQSYTNEDALQAAVKADEAMVEKAKLDLQYCTIASPLDGRIGNLLVHQGNVVKDNDTVLVTINQISPIYVAFSVPEQELPEIKKAFAERKVPVEAVLPNHEDHPIEGELVFINNQVDTSTGTILLKALYANRDSALWPGQFVNVSTTLSTLHNAVVIPSQALQTGQQGQYVYLVRRDMTVESRPVEPGSKVGSDVVVERGVQPGETVVTDGQLRLAPGARVEFKSAPPNPPGMMPQ